MEMMLLLPLAAVSEGKPDVTGEASGGGSDSGAPKEPTPTSPNPPPLPPRDRPATCYRDIILRGGY